MARKSKKAELRKQELIRNVPVDQRRMIMQPVTFAFLNGDMSVMHARIQTTIMDKLQERIARAVRKQHEDEQGFTGSLFSKEEFQPLEGVSGNYLKFIVKYSELGVNPANYRYISDAARAMQDSLFYEREQKNGYVRRISVFPVIDVPDETKKERRTDIKVYMDEEMAKHLFTFARYQKYLKDVVFLFSSGYAGRIYLLINANKYAGTWTIGYEKLRYILLATKNDKRDEKTGKYVVDKYKDIHDFKKRVLDTAKKEIDEAADHIDCTFDYEFRYPEGKKRGTPEAVIFHIHLTDTGRDILEQQREARAIVESRKQGGRAAVASAPTAQPVRQDVEMPKPVSTAKMELWGDDISNM